MTRIDQTPATSWHLPARLDMYQLTIQLCESGRAAFPYFVVHSSHLLQALLSRSSIPGQESVWSSTSPLRALLCSFCFSLFKNLFLEHSNWPDWQAIGSSFVNLTCTRWCNKVNSNNTQQAIFRLSYGTIKKNLNFPYANMKWFVWQWENTKIPLISLWKNQNETLKYWSHNVFGEFTLCFVNSTSIW